MEANQIPLDELVAIGIDVQRKATTIIASSLAIVSLISSSALIWMIKRSRASFTTTYNRILLAMAISDIIFSFSVSHFNFTTPIDDNYFVWNASGNQLTCSIQGFASGVGAASGLLYSCSLNLYSLAVVKYNKPDRYIRSKVEPFLHGIPVVLALIGSITLLAEQNINNGGGNCYAPVYKPPHCIGYEDGQTREGFDIPCGRGHDGAVLFFYVGGLTTTFLVPLIIGSSLGIIHRSVSKQENNMAGYGASNINRSNSRLVLHRVIAYSVSYVLTWSFSIIGIGFEIANMEWPTALWYLANIFNPLQGFFNFVIYIFPKVIRAKSRGDDNMTWFQAFKIAFMGGETGRATGRPRQEPCNRIPQAPGGRVGTMSTRDATTTEQLGEDDA
mmetsp:Transcript_10408/g.19144  ORF Transcript_10408/g.19144 Transcript_10408/m.19144 type:complete len:387 (+) Transcript_10408:597-1757(+)